MHEETLAADAGAAAPRLPIYTISESDLGMGASLGNSALWIHTKGNGAIERVFLNEIGEALAGAIALRYGACANPLERVQPGGDGQPSRDTFSGLYPEHGSRTFEIHPAYQRVRFRLARVLEVEETTFLPFGAISEAGGTDPAVVYIIVQIHNADDAPHHIRVMASAMLCGTAPTDLRAEYNYAARALVAYNESNTDWVRLFSASEPGARYDTTIDFGAAYDPGRLQPLANDVTARGDLIGRLQFDLTLAPQESRRIHFALCLSAAGAAEALRLHADAQAPDEMLQTTIQRLEQEVRRGRVLTPDGTINDGALWSKVNMRRVMASYPKGKAFTNDPGKYAIAVVRDCAWFIFGNDHFLPDFSRAMLDTIASWQYADGKLPEYRDMVDGRIEDYGLNINDDTPLYILAVNHHFRAAGDFDWLRGIYPSAARAARYIISQIDDRGLVFCSADDPRGDVWGIASWRNIIAGAKISGAVTEINAECVAALRAAAHLADNLGGLEKDRDDFSAASQRIRDAMDRYLINPDNGLYYLNIDVQGIPHTDVTGDQIFPVMMRACSEDTGFRIISRLNYSDFWTEAGLRTVSRNDLRFDPSLYSGLLGGVWPGLTWWYAFGAARYHPGVMVRALRSSFAHYGSDPKRNNTVPGQFSEWFDGESLENRGMRLSPWEPPRFLWAAIEGVCGLVLQPGAARINPLIPSHWGWAGLRDLPYHGAFLSYFIVRDAASGYRVFTTAPVESAWDVDVYARDMSDFVRVYSDHVCAIALARDGAAVILLGNTGTQTEHTPVVLAEPIATAPQFHVRIYDSERAAWEEIGTRTVDQVHGHTFSIDAGGFRLIELAETQNE